MIISENLFAIEDCLADFALILAKTPSAKEFQQARLEFRRDPRRAQLEQKLLTSYQKFLLVKDYPSAPDYQQKKSEFYQIKRQFDLLPSVANLKIKQNQFQLILDEIAQQIAQTVSPQIKVDPGAHNFQKFKKKCSECGSGGNYHG